MERIYACIDLKSFFASVECIDRGLDPLDVYLVVADEERTDKTICLAVTPALKAYGIPGRVRLYEAKGKVREANYNRKKSNGYKEFIGKTISDKEFKNDSLLELDFIKATPRMKLYMKYSTDIYNIYLKYISAEDILVYSIDEVFCDLTSYLKFYNMSAEELVVKILKDVYDTTGITATAGIGTNMYLAKVAMDVTAKKMDANEFGVRMAFLDEDKYKRELWSHRPITDFWRIGKGYARKLEDNGMYTLGDVARMSIDNEDFLYKLFGVNAELLIDHVWGYEPCTIDVAKRYVPSSSSISMGQVLHCPYDCKKTRLIVKEMVDNLVLELVDKRLLTNQIVLTIGYDVENLTNSIISARYDGDIVKDSYGRFIPKHAHGTVNIDHYCSSTKIIMDKVMELFDRIVNPILLVRRINVVACNLIGEDKVKNDVREQLDLFSDFDMKKKKKDMLEHYEVEEKNLQRTILDIKKRYGKNSILKGMNFEEGATSRDRNNEVGGHKS